MESPNWYDKIEDYLDGTLPPEEKTSMDAAIAWDPGLAREVLTYQAEREALRLLSEEKARADFQRWTKNLDPAPVVKPSRSPWIYGGVFAFLIALGIWIWQSQQDEPPAEQVPSAAPVSPTPSNEKDSKLQEQTPGNNLAPIAHTPSQGKPGQPAAPSTGVPDNIPGFQRPVEVDNTRVLAFEKEARSSNMYAAPEELLLRGSKDHSSIGNYLTEGMEAYKKADYTNAISLLGKVSQVPERPYAEALFVKGHAYFQLRQYGKAAFSFHEVTQLDTDLVKEAKYMEALSLFAGGAKDKVRLKGLLEELKDKLPPVKNKAVTSMLEKLE